MRELLAVEVVLSDCVDWRKNVKRMSRKCQATMESLYCEEQRRDDKATAEAIENEQPDRQVGNGVDCWGRINFGELRSRYLA